MKLFDIKGKAENAEEAKHSDAVKNFVDEVKNKAVEAAKDGINDTVKEKVADTLKNKAADAAIEKASSLIKNTIKAS